MKINQLYIPDNPGCLEDYQDDRDIPLSAIQKKEEIPEEFKRDLSKIEINEQRHPSCIGHASAKVKESQELIELGDYKFSPRFIYALCKKYDDYDGKGTYPRVAMKMLKKYGVCQDSLFPYDQDYQTYINTSLISNEAYLDATKFRIKMYAKVAPDFGEIKQAIYKNKVVLGGGTGSNEGWSQLPIKPPKDGEKKWGHAIAFYGYDKDYIYFINSWGKNWGENGIGYFGRDYVPYLHSTWTSVDALDMLPIIGDKKTKKQYVLGQDNKLRHIFNETLLEELNKAGVINKDTVHWKRNLKDYEIMEPWAVIKDD